MTCQICFEDKELVKGPYECDTNHFFCQECINQWNSRQNTCPICRSKSIYNPLSDIEFIHSWQILSGNRRVFTLNNRYPIVLNPPTYSQRRRFRRSRSDILTVFATLNSLELNEIQLQEHIIQPEIPHPESIDFQVQDHIFQPERQPESLGVLSWIFQCCQNIIGY